MKTDMRPWQHGIEISELKKIESKYKEHNARAASPFSQFKKNNIAEAIHKRTLRTFPEDGIAQVTTSKVKSNVVMHGDVVIGTKLPGDLTITNMYGTPSEITTFLNSFLGDSVWLYLWAADHTQNMIAKDCGFQYVGAKISSFGEVFSIWFRLAPILSSVRVQPGIPAEDTVHIKKLWDVPVPIIKTIETNVQLVSSKFQNHYSNYNIKNSWSAFSLRGYRSDPRFITKPVEMNKKWKEEHKDVDFEMQDTYLYDDLFPQVRTLLKELDGDIHRVRFMKLNPGGGELGRHTDQVDPDAGNGLGKLARLHWPIVTAPEVVFTVWNHRDVRTDVNMQVGECWMLDTRKPHKVYNGSNIDRIHLVVDTIVTPKLLNRILS